MKKYLLLLCLLIFAWAPLIVKAQSQEVDTLTKQNVLPLSEKTYDKLLKENLVKNFVDKAAQDGGTESSLERITHNPDGGITNVLWNVNILIGGFAILWLAILGAKFIFSQGDEEKISKYKKQFGWIILGLTTIAVGEFVAFQVWHPSQDILEGTKSVSMLSQKINQIKLFIQILIGGIMLMSIMMSGYNLITGSEQDEKIEQEKNVFQSFLIGTFLILTSEILARVFGAQNAAGDYVKPEEMVSQGVSEIVGLINFSLTFIGGATTLMLILSSLYYIISFGNEDQMSRAKRIIIACVIGLIVVISSYTAIRFMIR